MKKLIYLLLLLIFVPVSLFAAITGSGSWAIPYSGTLSSGSLSISGTKYFSTITVSGTGILTIDPGATFFGAYTTSQISVSGTGILNAVGAPGSLITISADNNGNGIHDAGETWKDIYFLGNGASQINYAIIEFGTGNLANSQGGGIYIYQSGKNISVKNTEIRNCTGVNGGGIFALSNSTGSVTLENLKIHDNIANGNGGGMFIGGGGVSVTASNCEVYYNDATARGDGLYINSGSTTCTVFNSLIYNHSSGDGIYSVSAGNASIVNCTVVNNQYGITATTALVVTNTVVWGNSSSQITGGSITATYCGIMGGYSGTDNVNLSSLNGDALGPNFTTVGSDWSIKFISPLRDAGTSGGSPTPPPTDFLSKSRIYNYDIGAYEVQYSRWTGASSGSWSTDSNWEQSILPSVGTGDVIIPVVATNYPNESSVTNNSGNYLIIEPSAHADFGALTNNGVLWLRSDITGATTGIFSLKVNSYSGSGSSKIEMYIPGSAWHYITPPVSSIPTTLFSASPQVRNVDAYMENYITDNMNNGWLSYEGMHYNTTTSSWEDLGTTWPNLLAGKAYNYYYTSARTFYFSGTINTTAFPFTLAYQTGGAGNPSQQGYNLIGNPYTCGIDWQTVIDQSGWDSNIEKAIYFRRSGATYTYANGVTTPSLPISGQFIPPTQGFFIKTNANNATFTIPLSAKIHTAQARHKGEELVPLIRLQLDKSGTIDETVIRFDEKATALFDNDFDARKNFTSPSSPYISTLLNNIEYTINGIAFPVNSVSIPVVVNAPNSGNYIINANEITGLENFKVYLIDNLSNATFDLGEIKSYPFTSLAGKFTDRFILKIVNITTGVPEIGSSTLDFNIYSGNGVLNIQTISDEWNGLKGDIIIYDLAGRILKIERKTGFVKGEIIQIPFSNKGMTLVEIKSGLQRYVGKVVIR